MINTLYLLLIFPIEQILELCFIFVLRLINNPALSVLGISFAVSILTLPLYLMGEKHQQSERDIQKQMKPEVDNIKTVFSGDERFMRLATYYRQNRYHPLYSLRSSIPLIIQIPFFIAAYHFLSNLEMIQGVSFGPIADMGKPDALLTIKNISINILPIVMTLINLIAAAFYVKGSSVKEKVQLYGMAALFLILLFNSPSGLVLYWTGNNLFSLVKNIIQKTKEPKLITLALVSELCLFLDIYLLFIHKGWIVKRLFLVLLITGIPLYQYLPVLFNKIKQKLFAAEKNIERIKIITITCVCEFVFILDFYLLFINKHSTIKRVSLAVVLSFIPFLPFIYRYFKQKYPNVFDYKANKKNNTGIFILSLLLLFLLAGFVIPSSLIASSVQEFSLIFGEIVNPFAFIIDAVLQSAGIFFIWPLLIYLLFSKEIKNKMTMFAVVICTAAVINVLLFPGNYGFLTIDFIFSENVGASNAVYFANLLVIAIAVIMALFLVRNFNKAVLFGLIIAVCSVLAVGYISSIKIHKEFNSFQSRDVKKEVFSYEPVFQFSKTGKNVLVIMLDRAISGYIPYIFNEKQELNNSFDGFTWYKNTISFGPYTNFGVPGLFGGYEYTPLEMNKRKDMPLVIKHNEALLLLPKIFLDKGYKVTVTEPPYANYSWISDLSIYDNYPEIHAENIIGKYNKKWLLDRMYKTNQNIDIIVNNEDAMIKSDMIRFSFFKIAPLLFRHFIYDNGKWLNIEKNSFNNNDEFMNFNKSTLDNYIALDILEKITEIDGQKFDTYTAITNNLTHQPAFLQFPDYVPANNITDKGNGPFSNKEHYHVNMAALLLLGKWFDFLKENEAYDNTRIIIVSDHGRKQYVNFQDNVVLPNNKSLQDYAALLLIKDFNSHGSLSVDDSFMTNADVPIIALEDIINNPINPWTGNLLKSDKEDGITLTTSTLWDIKKHPTNTFDIKPEEWLHVHTDIYNSNNWSLVNKQ